MNCAQSCCHHLGSPLLHMADARSLRSLHSDDPHSLDHWQKHFKCEYINSIPAHIPVSLFSIKKLDMPYKLQQSIFWMMGQKDHHTEGILTL